MSNKISGISNVINTDELLRQAIEKFRISFNDTEPTIACCAPGRVNLIGEHVDYNDGYVLPIALQMVTVIVGKINDTTETTDSIADIITCCDGADDPKRVKIDLKHVTPGSPRWANYVKGVIHNAITAAVADAADTDTNVVSLPGFNAVIMSNVPMGGGLSSSAALEVATLTFLEAITNGQLSPTPSDKALICQKAEHTFVGMPCGIMDQLISVMGIEQHALLIDCKSLETIQIPFESNDISVLICNSNVRHELSSSEYPIRRRQCMEALELMNLPSYRNATLQHLSALQNVADEVLIKRARHVITEIQRTCEAAEALKAHDFVKMGKLMIESHLSLRDDFQVSCEEVDLLVDTAIQLDGVFGARMTGGGFGGCTVALVRQENVAAVVEHIDRVYSVNGRKASYYVCMPSNGARQIPLKNNIN